MKFLIVGIGNIGPEYAETRHNIGFKVVDALARKHGAEFQSKRLADYAEFRWRGKQFGLIKPTNYVNRSGRSVAYWMDQLNVDKQRLLVVVDDLALPYGTLRLKGKGSDGGHNGLKDINQHIGGKDYPRLRFGIGDDFARGRQVDYVLGEWSEDELIDLDVHIDRAIEAVEQFASMGIERSMNIVNTRE